MKLVSALVISLGTFAIAENDEKTHGRTNETSPKFATAELALNVDKWMRLNDPIANTIHSPVSLYNILASVYFGTGETSETRKELQEKFNFKKSFSPEKYSKKLGGMTRNDALDSFNSYIFHKNNVMPEYAAELASLNFKDKPLESFVGQEEMINELIERDTDNMIKDMFSPGSFDGQTSLVLLNTILFKGIWDGRLGKFDPYNTEKKEIWVMGTEKESPGPFTAEFMTSKKRKMKILEDKRTLHISLRFKGGVWMTIVMPKAGSGTKAHEVNFNSVKWESFSRKEATLTLPKFEIESDLDLVEFMKHQNSSRLFFFRDR
jgi:serine protease inhibitor